MLRNLFGALVLSAALAAPALAQNSAELCEPARGQAFTVANVKANDTLDVRSGAGSRFESIARLARGTTGLLATGRVRFTSEFCAAACADLLRGQSGALIAVRVQCHALGRIWYEVKVPRGVTGWAPARFLDPVVPAAPGKPGRDETLRLVCRTGERIDVTLRPRKDDALVITGDGLDLVMKRQPSRLEIDYASREFGGVSIRGSRTRLDWTGPGQTQATLCVPRP